MPKRFVNISIVRPLARLHLGIWKVTVLFNLLTMVRESLTRPLAWVRSRTLRLRAAAAPGAPVTTQPPKLQRHRMAQKYPPLRQLQRGPWGLALEPDAGTPRRDNPGLVISQTSEIFSCDFIVNALA